MPITLSQLCFWSQLVFWNAYDLVQICHEWKTAFDSLLGQSCWTPSKHSGHFFLVASGSPSYRSGYHTTKPDAVCHQFSPHFFHLRTQSHYISLLHWGKRERGSWRCNKKDQILFSAPPICLFVPDSARLHVLQWGPYSRPPWPNLDPTLSFGNAFGGTLWSEIPGLSNPHVLHVPLGNSPYNLWLDLSTFFSLLRIPGLTLEWILSLVFLPLDGKTTILMMVDRFSKAVNFIPLIPLCATETLDLMAAHGSAPRSCTFHYSPTGRPTIIASQPCPMSWANSGSWLKIFPSRLTSRKLLLLLVHQHLVLSAL